MKNYHIITFGCQMNVYDSGRLRGLLAERGWRSVATLAEADFIFLNACSIREKAAQRVIARLKELKPLKKARPSVLIGVGGCLAEQEGVAFLAQIPFLSLIVGPGRLGEIPERLASLDPQGPALILTGTGRASETASPGSENEVASEEESEIASEARPTPPGPAALSSFLTIMEGCDNFCAYCVVPYLRGRERSRPPAAILREAESLLAQGCREITLLGQNVNSYAPTRLDPLEPGQPPFVALLKKLAAYPELWRLRFTTSHPKDFSPELIELFGSLPTLCPQLHLPLQSGSDAILRAMGRRYDRAGYLELVRQLRQANPQLALSTDIIVGFPGETEADWRMTQELLAEIRFDSIFSFKYSDRPQTRAQNLPNKVPELEKSRRLFETQLLQKAITLEINQTLVGQTLEVLVTGTGRRPGQLSGRTGSLKIVNFPGPNWLQGQLTQVEITEAHVASLLGRLPEAQDTFARSA
ncbi:MAG: tRNA (N6-isopentenyl adenosine(37)-C2)-methylthiotransferase MiaB [Deltaproteobacteria bacterium]|jgi:tRNA-2-methylthio-N6-dimethylallyladenosine synthase|nr:tRNA (N6-isopentenyl adenosine(37)-C2)-methylthiotransferase MiaB [Deltaproteobacteria bacterium]